MVETFEIQSDIANLPQVEERLFHLCDDAHLGDCCPLVTVSVLKAVENAILHGNHSDSSKKVGLTFGRWEKGIYVEVADEGEGFNTDEMEKHLAEAETVGSGLFIMKSLADHVKFANGGRTVRLEFAVGGINTTCALSRVAILQEWLTREERRCHVA